MRLRTICIFFLFFQLCNLNSQQYNFKNISTNEGLPSSECFHILQDKKGYLWISTTSGLAKYNVRTFKTFTSADGLTDNTIFETYEDEYSHLFYFTSNSRIGYIYNDSAYIPPVADLLQKE